MKNNGHSSNRSNGAGLTGSIGVPHHEHPSYKWWVLANVMMGTFMVVLDSTIVDVSLAKVMATFGVGIDTVKWIATGYLLAFAVSLPTSGWIADHFGFRKTYTIGLALFTVGSLLCSISWNMTALIAFRALQGVGGGLLMPVGMAIVVREFPPEKRGLALGFWAIASAASVSLGPTLGGYLIDNFAWHAIFDINVPVGVVGVFATLMIQREYKTESRRAFDIIGFLSIVLFLTPLLIALSDGNASWNTGGWTSPFILSCFALSLIGLVIFLSVEFNMRHPLIELRLLKNFNFGMSNLILFIFGMGMFGSTFLLPLYLQNGLGFTAFQAGSLFLPLGLIMAVMGPISGILSDKANPKIVAAVGIAALALSLFVNRYLSLFSMTSDIMVSLYLRGFGMALIFTPLNTLSLAEVPKDRLAQASGLFNVIRQIGGSFGVAIMGTLLTDRTIFHTTMYGQAVSTASPVTQNVLHGLQNFAQQVLGSTVSLSSMRANALRAYNISQQAFVSAVDDDFLVAALITAACIIPIVFLRYKKREGERIKAVAMD